MVEIGRDCWCCSSDPTLVIKQGYPRTRGKGLHPNSSWISAAKETPQPPQSRDNSKSLNFYILSSLYQILFCYFFTLFQIEYFCLFFYLNQHFLTIGVNEISIPCKYCRVTQPVSQACCKAGSIISQGRTFFFYLQWIRQFSRFTRLKPYDFLLSQFSKWK